MERYENTDLSRNDSDMMGAIFMCNQTTKKECFRRKLFGLPASQAGFVKKVRAGMLLFLFEYEKRNLYGVFEAASDGEMNTLPGAFSRAGSSFPAQVQFSILWTCHPLSEDEFRGAIQENYFAPYKFNFGLSHKQVARLIELFSLKKISPQNHQSLVSRSRENYKSGNNYETGRARSLRVDTTECGLENDMNLKSGFGVKQSMYNENHDPTSGHCNVGVEHGSYSRVPAGLQSQLPSLMCSPAQIDHASEGSVSFSPKGHPWHHIVPSFKGEQPYDVFGADKPNLAQKHTETQALHFRSYLYPSHQDLETCNLPSIDYLKPDSFYESSVDRPILTHRFTETQIPHFRSLSYPSQQDPGTIRLSSTSNRGLVSSSHHDDLPFHKGSYVEFRNYVNRDPAASKFYAPNATDSFDSALGLSNTHGFSEASLDVDNARGLRYWKLLPDNSNFPLMEDENLFVNMEHPQFPCRYSSDPCHANEYDRAGDAYCSQGDPTAACSKIESVTSQRRTSVFSRLKVPKGFGLKDNISDADINSSRNLLKLLSQRRNQWNKMARGSKRLLACSNSDDGKRLDNVDQREPIDADSIVELASDSEKFNKQITEAPFINFKRRSEVQKMDDETKGSCPAEGGGKGKCKRRKLIRPSLTEDDPFSQTNRVSRIFQSSSQEIVAINPAVMNAENYGSEGNSVPNASFGNGEHISPNGCTDGSRGSGEEGAETGMLMKLHFGMADGRILSSRPMTDANAETFSGESCVECSQRSGKKFHVVGGKPDEIGVKNKSPGKNPRHDIVKVDLRYEGNNPSVVREANTRFSINCIETYLEPDANSPNPDSATMEQDHLSKFDLNLPVINSCEVSENTEMMSGGNAGKDSFSSDISYGRTSVVNSDIGGILPADHKCLSNKSDEDTDKENKVFLSCNFGSAQMIVNHEAEEVDKSFTLTAELKNVGNSSDLLSGKEWTSTGNNINRISVRSGANFAHLSIVKSEAKGVTAGQMFNC